MNKFIKSIVAAAALVAAYFTGSHFAHAQTQPAAIVNFSGPEVGLDLDALHADNTSVDTKTKFDFGYAGRIGYGYQTSQGYFLGVEGSEGTNSGVTRNPHVKDTTGDDLTADIRAGKVIGSNLVYGKVGYELRDVAEKNMLDNAKNSYNFSGYRLGAGMERFLMTNVTGRADVVYSAFGSQLMDGQTVDPSGVKTTIGVSYKLN